MRKIEDETPEPTAATEGGDALRVDMAPSAVRRTRELRSLVRFAIGRGYYDRWNGNAESDLTENA